MSSATCDPQKSLRVDRLLETLSHRARRELIHYFENRTGDDVVSLDDAVAQLDERIQRSNRSSLESSLHHTHLPRLEKRGWVEYDARTGDIRYRGPGDAGRLLGQVTDVFEER